MKSTMTISVENDLKNEFFIFSKELGTNPTNLVNMFMKDSIRRRRIEFSTSPQFEIELEPFSEEEILSFGEDFIQKTHAKTKKLETLLAKI